MVIKPKALTSGKWRRSTDVQTQMVQRSKEGEGKILRAKKKRDDKKQKKVKMY